MNHNTDIAALLLRIGLGTMFVGGGVALIGGIRVRAISIALLPVLLGAVFVHFESGWVFSNPNGGWEYPAFLTLVSIAVALLGPGKYVLPTPALFRTRAA